MRETDLDGYISDQDFFRLKTKLLQVKLKGKRKISYSECHYSIKNIVFFFSKIYFIATNFPYVLFPLSQYV